MSLLSHDDLGDILENWKTQKKNLKKYENLKNNSSFTYVERLKKITGDGRGATAVLGLYEDVYADAWVDSVNEESLVELKNIVKPQVKPGLVMDDALIRSFVAQNVSAYWEALLNENDRTREQQNEMNRYLHPLGAEVGGRYSRNSLDFLSELNSVFLHCLKSDGNLVDSVFYYGSNFNSFERWFEKNTIRKSLNTFENVEQDANSLFSDFIHNPVSFEDVLNKGLFDVVVKKMNRTRHDLIFLDFDSVRANKVVGEFIDLPYYYELLYHAVKNIDDGGNVVIRLSGVEGDSTKEMLSTFGSYFKTMKLYHPLCKDHMTMNPFVCFRGKRSRFEASTVLDEYVKRTRNMLLKVAVQNIFEFRSRPKVVNALFGSKEKRLFIDQLIQLNVISKNIRAVYNWQSNNVWIWQNQNPDLKMPEKVVNENLMMFDFVLEDNRAFCVSLLVEMRKSLFREIKAVGKDFVTDSVPAIKSELVADASMEIVDGELVASIDVSKYELFEYIRELIAMVYQSPSYLGVDWNADTVVNGKPMRDWFLILRNKLEIDMDYRYVDDFIFFFSLYMCERNFWPYSHVLMRKYDEVVSEKDIDELGKHRFAEGGVIEFYEKDNSESDNWFVLEHSECQIRWTRSCDFICDFKLSPNRRDLLIYFVDSIGYILKSRVLSPIFKKWFETLNARFRTSLCFSLVRRKCGLGLDYLYRYKIDSNGNTCRIATDLDSEIRNFYDYDFTVDEVYELMVNDWGWQLEDFKFDVSYGDGYFADIIHFRCLVNTKYTLH